MKYSVFYRSYRGDFEWLKYSLSSLKKFLKDYSEIVIVVPKQDYDLIKQELKSWDIPKGIVVYRDLTWAQDDYMAQQITKIKSFNYVSFPYILFVDSDVIFKADTDIQQFVRDGKPCILKTPYTALSETSEQGTDKKGAACVWQAITEKAAGFPVEFEYMRRLPLLYDRNTLSKLCWYFIDKHGMIIEDYVGKVTERAFSEFNLIGAYAENSWRGKYYFLDTTKEELPVLNCRQFWSWGGLTPEIKTEIENIIG